MTTCDRCLRDAAVGEHGVYLCPREPRRGNTVIGDDIPGGVLVYHGLCDEVTGAPIRDYSKSAMAAEAKRRGIQNVVRHVGINGTDRSPHATRWV